MARVREIAWRDPLAAFAPLSVRRGAMLLGGGPASRWSVIVADPALVLEVCGGVCRIDGRPTGASPLDALRTMLSARRLSAACAGAPAPPFVSGAVGLLGYEVGALLEPAAGRAPPRAGDPAGAAPPVFFGVYDAAAAFDRSVGRAFVTGRGPGAEVRMDALEEALGGGPSPVPWRPPALHALGATFSPGAYRAAVARIVGAILDGEAFQANLSQQIFLEGAGRLDAYALYRGLAGSSSAPYAAFLNLGSQAVVSNSPECFLEVDANDAAAWVRTRPIKGTRPRGANPAADAALVQDLADSAKDKAENTMIVDLMRNDLSRICADHSIAVGDLCRVKTFAHVHHLVSEVSGRLKPGLGAVDALSATFPAGSITGAPKIRAMQLIAAEERVARGPYCGAIGYIDDRGGAEFSVAIRTLTAQNDGGGGWRASFGVGGGVVADSEPEAEYQETLDKAADFLTAFGLSRRDVETCSARPAVAAAP